MKPISRRSFLASSSLAFAAATLPASRVLGANDRINMGFIGMGGRGAGSARWFGKEPDV